MLYVKFLSILILAKSAFGANILALMVVLSHSHHLWNSKYLEALASRGHKITYLTVDKYKNPPGNIKTIYLDGIYETVYSQINTSEIALAGPYESERWMYFWETLQGELLLESKEMERLREVLKREKFDLVVHDVALCPFLLGAVDVLGRPPVIGITAYSAPTHALNLLGNPIGYSSVPHFYVSYTNNMNFFQRINNYVLYLYSFAVRWFVMRKQNEFSLKFFGNDVRDLSEILDDINIIMVNTNDGIDHAFPKVPGLIPVAGLHIQKPKPLPQDLQSYLDEAKDGAVYFSLGSNVLSSELESEKIKILIEAFRKLSPLRILWKWETDSLPNKPENVKVGKWLPQNDILAHPNVRLFFTHSGLLSTQEALYHGKPIVGMPFFLDQHVNIQKCISRGLGEYLSYSTLKTEDVVSTIRKVLNNPMYAENARNASLVFKDQLVNPLEKAVYWTEYAIKHNGARHLRFSSRNLSWYQNSLLDIFLLVSGLIFTVLYLVMKVLKFFGLFGGSKLKTD